MSKLKGKQGTNWILTIALILGCVTVLFPLYMTVVIAFKNPTEMTKSCCKSIDIAYLK